MVDPAGIRRFGPPHIPSPKPRICNVYVESGKKKKTLTSLPETMLDLTQLSAVEKFNLKVSVISGNSYLSHSSTIMFIVMNQ